MIQLRPVELEGHGVRLEPLSVDHVEGLAAAAADGELWRLSFTSVPPPEETLSYVEGALEGQEKGHMLPWVVRAGAGGGVVGSTRYHDVMPALDRVEIGYTWYARGHQRSAVNSACKLLLLGHAFEEVGCEVVGLRTDHMNFRSQRAIEGLGAKKDGVIRHHAQRPDGSVRNSVMYSILAQEWADVKKHLETRLWRHGGENSA